MIREADVEAVVALMERIGVHFAGSRARRVREAVARDGIAYPSEVVFALAVDGGNPCGLVIALVERARYWRKFTRRHPRAAVAIGAHRLARRVRRRFARGSVAGARDIAAVAATRTAFGDRITAPGRERWEDAGPGIAKVMYVAVDPAHRRGGVGAALYRWFFRALAAAGIPRCDAEVSEDNVGAATLHRRFPFRVSEVHGGYFLVLATAEVA